MSSRLILFSYYTGADPQKETMMIRFAEIRKKLASSYFDYGSTGGNFGL